MKHCKFSPVFVAVLTLSATLAQAQAAAENTQTLAPVTISASRGTQLEDMDISTSVMSREEIIAAPEASVDQIVSRIPGIFIPTIPTTELHPTGQTLNIRGFGSSTNGLTLVLVDGVPANDPYFRTVNWAQIPKEQIERIEVIRGGGATSLWGNMAMGGVINIVTRDPVAGQKTVSTSYGSYNSRTAGASVGVGVSDTLRVGVSYDGAWSDGYLLVPTLYQNPYMVATSSQVANINANAVYTPNATSRYFIKLQGSQTAENGLVWNDTNNQWNTYRLTFGGSTKVSDKAAVNVSGWYSYGEMGTQNASQNPAYSVVTPGTAVPYVSQLEKATYNSLGGTAYVQSETDTIKDIKYGVDLRNVSINDPITYLNSSGTTTGTVAAQATHQFAGVFVQGTQRFTSLPLDVTLGLRQDYWQAVNASVVAGGANGTTSLSGLTNSSLPNASFTQFDPRLGAKYYVNDAWDVRGALYTNFSAPGLNQMYRSFGSGGYLTVPNTSLQPQTNQGGEIGADFRQGDFNFAMTAFNNQLTNYIDYVVTSSTTKQYVNAGNANIYGAEFFGGWKQSPEWAFTGGLTRTVAYLTSSANATYDPTNIQLAQVPQWMASLGTTWTPDAQWRVTMVVKAFPDYYGSISTLGTQYNQGSVLADLGVVYKYNRTLDIFGFAQNIGSTSYYDQGLTYNTNTGAQSTGSYPSLGMPFSVTVGMRATF